MTPAHQRRLLKIFAELYPSPRSELNFENHYQLTVAVILSAQCTDKKVNEITPELFNRFPAFSDLAKAAAKDLEAIIRPVNYYITKAKHLVALAKLLSTDNCGRLPKSRVELQKLPGIGPKTAGVLLTEMGQAAIPVDTHVFRVSKRLGLAQGKNPGLVEAELMEAFAQEHWRDLHHWLIFHGRRVCKAQRPLCSECPLKKLCPFGLARQSAPQ